MDNSNIQYKNNKIICEKVNCSSYATTKIKVKVKDIGSIMLQLCDKCKVQFLNIGEMVNE